LYKAADEVICFPGIISHSELAFFLRLTPRSKLMRKNVPEKPPYLALKLV
jgi:hypothetical protein